MDGCCSTRRWALIYPAAIAESAQDATSARGGKRGAGRKGGGGFGGGPAPTKPYEFVVLALDRGTGKTIWQKTARKEVPHEGRHQTNTFASASPVTDGEYLYVPFGSRGFYCYDLDGNLKWEKDLGDMRTRGGFGEGASPALAGRWLIINWDHEDQSFIVALDKKTGAEVWRRERDEISSWSTPLIVEHAGQQQAIVAASKRTRSYDVATGEVLFITDSRQPVVAGALRALLDRLGNPLVGCVTGNLVLEGGAGSGFYWLYENWIRTQESNFRSVVGMTGPIAAVPCPRLPYSAFCCQRHASGRS